MPQLLADYSFTLHELLRKKSIFISINCTSALDQIAPFLLVVVAIICSAIFNKTPWELSICIHTYIYNNKNSIKVAIELPTHIHTHIYTD